jgi:hypothetical protein
MTDVKVQQTCNKFCFKFAKRAEETYKMLKEAFGDTALGQMQTYEWFKHFKNGQLSVDDEKHSGWHSTKTMTKNVAISARGYPGRHMVNDS